MSKKKKMWVVVATHKRGAVRPIEANQMRMGVVMDWRFASSTFTSKQDAMDFVRGLRRDNLIPKGVELWIVSNDAWDLIVYAYYGQLTRFNF